MNNVITWAALVLAAGAAPSFAAGRGELKTGESHSVVVAFEALFDAEGRVMELRPHEAAEHPAAFWDGLKQKFSGLKIPAPRNTAGQPATLRTGLYIQLEVTPGEKEGPLKITGLDVRPLVTRRAYAGYPQDIAQAAGWTGAVEAECVVGTDGRCGDVKVTALPGMPPSVLRWATATLAMWEFMPPQFDGVPIAVPFRQAFSLTSADDMPVEFRYRGSGDAPFRW